MTTYKVGRLDIDDEFILLEILEQKKAGTGISNRALTKGNENGQKAARQDKAELGEGKTGQG